MIDLWLVQYLCPSRHALMASPYDRAAIDPAQQEQALIAGMLQFGVQAYCGICGSRDLHFEHGKLPYDNWDDALRALRLTEAANIASRLEIDQARHNNN